MHLNGAQAHAHAHAQHYHQEHQRQHTTHAGIVGNELPLTGRLNLGLWGSGRLRREEGKGVLGKAQAQKGPRGSE